ncbi:MAG: hypothetical protein DME25_04550 [Verrucomicrobia bacterium]|nr:MAG: hypothetical protein DME25_04550 [Verrucomicrobiota bacterium]
MKACFILLPVFVALAAKAEPTNAPPQAAPESLQTEAAKPSRETPPVIKELKPNEIEAGNLTYSGILVEAVKVDNPLQLINPAAPEEYGSPEDNVVRNPMDGKVAGLKIFSLQF